MTGTGGETLIWTTGCALRGFAGSFGSLWVFFGGAFSKGRR